MATDRSEATRRQLCLAAEALVAMHGLATVTLRSVAAAAGQRNTAAVSYHFGSMEKLLRAVVDMRVREMEPERQRLIAEAGQPPAAMDPFVAWRCMMRPVLSLADEQARHAHVRFLTHMRTAGLLSDPFDASIKRPGAPTMELLLDRLHAALATLPYELARARIALCGLMFWNAIALYDERALGAASPSLELSALLADVEGLVDGILKAPANARVTNDTDMLG